MDNNDKVITLFSYIKELYEQKYSIIADVKAQQWFQWLSEIPANEAYVKLNYLDRLSEDDEMGEEKSIILEVSKPEFEKCPSIPEILLFWVEPGWQKFNNQALRKDSIQIYKGETLTTENFTDDPLRVSTYNYWSKDRDRWVIRQLEINKIRLLFNQLYLIYNELENNSEAVELMVGQGILSCQSDLYEFVSHPILLKRLSMEFLAKQNIIRIIDSNVDPELYTMLLQKIDFINHLAVKGLKDDLEDNFYHPLDRKETPEYLKSFAHRLHSDSKYSSDLNDRLNEYDKLIIYDHPVFFVRKRTGGVVKAIEDIIGQIEETGQVSGPLLNLIGENVSQFSDSLRSLDLSQSLAAINGEDKSVLLSKEANEEQLEIARQIEKYNAVLVQGPPGTGKTHTIANLIGHFLAQGKNILVTSHTRKALSVVKEKVVPELQDLCVSVLYDNNLDMERSVDGISEYISSHNSLELHQNSEKLKRERDKIIDDLSNIRQKSYSIKFKEYESIVFDGKEYSPAEAARFVHENRENLSYIPGKVKLNQPLPVTIGDLELVYKSNSEISVSEEIELENKLPNPDSLLAPYQFESAVKSLRKIEEQLERINEKFDKRLKYNLNQLEVEYQGEKLYKAPDLDKVAELKDMIRNNVFQFSGWEIHAILDGKKGGGFKKVWEDLYNLLDETYQLAGDTVQMTVGKSLTGSHQVDEETIRILCQIKEHLNEGKKLSGLVFLIHRDWKAILENISLNGQPVRTAEDCQVLIVLCRLKLKRDQLRLLWDELIFKNGGINFDELGQEPEETGIQYNKIIKASLNWYEDTFSRIKNCFVQVGFNAELMKEDQINLNAQAEIEFLTHKVYNDLPLYIEIVELIEEDLRDLKGQLDSNLEILTSYKNSVICKLLSAVAVQKNATRYREIFDQLNKLYEKNFFLSERFRILKSIEGSAPEWAAMIKNRTGIHGQADLPANIEEAWKWKQFAGLIEEITKQPFDKLQRQMAELTGKLRQLTAVLSENLSWYHLLTRIEGDISKKQALQGWKMTVKKIGKGTGKRAPALRREAKKLMAECQTSVPAWIMPVNKALETLDPRNNRFDIVIIDEASQSDISALAIMYLAKKIIIVGDDEQVSPSAVGIDQEKMHNLAKMTIQGLIPNSHLYDMNSSLYDIGKTTFPTLMLKEHFRCVPSIINYSNRLSYDFKIRPLRDDSQVMVKPATAAYQVYGQREGRKKVNELEAKTVVALMLACMRHMEYDKMTFGAISMLGEDQAKRIYELAIEKIEPSIMEERRILCGNAASFQGDERDIIFLSLVDSNEGDGPLRMTGEGSGKSTKQRYNVAASRARNQLWVVHSLDVFDDLKAGDMRRDLIEYVSDPKVFSKQQFIEKKSNSPFEIAVSGALEKNGFRIVQHWQVGAYRIDLVAVSGEKKIAIECDGELYSSGAENIRVEMEKQAVLERLGWRFIHIRGSEYYGDPEATLKRVMRELKEFEIEPETEAFFESGEKLGLKERVIATAKVILDDWEKESEALSTESEMS
ncbi:AAA domain-containing protein [Eubacteriaceae bacterium ES3]|nr:AAA domain-containing protein [Eubacteriaceae bacterium ES3]